MHGKDGEIVGLIARVFPIKNKITERAILVGGRLLSLRLADDASIQLGPGVMLVWCTYNASADHLQKALWSIIGRQTIYGYRL